MIYCMCTCTYGRMVSRVLHSFVYVLSQTFVPQAFDDGKIEIFGFWSLTMVS